MISRHNAPVHTWAAALGLLGQSQRVVGKHVETVIPTPADDVRIGEILFNGVPVVKDNGELVELSIRSEADPRIRVKLGIAPEVQHGHILGHLPHMARIFQFGTIAREVGIDFRLKSKSAVER